MKTYTTTVSQGYIFMDGAGAYSISKGIEMGYGDNLQMSRFSTPFKCQNLHDPSVTRSLT